MPEKKMLIVPAELVRRIDENRGDLTQGEFIEFLIDTQLRERGKGQEEKKYTTKEEMHSFEADIKKLLKSFLEFFVGYGLELGKGPAKTEVEELTAKLHELETDLGSEDGTAEAKIKWK